VPPLIALGCKQVEAHKAVQEIEETKSAKDLGGFILQRLAAGQFCSGWPERV